MLSQPLVSVIIPCYNHSKYVVDTLNSVVKDTYENKEICIIDDGSKDDSVKYIQEWIDLHQHEIKIKFKTWSNRGLCATLNELIKMAEGEYLLPCASDDILLENTIAYRVNFMMAHPEKKVFVSDSQVIDEKNKLVMLSSLAYHGGDIQDYSDPHKMLKTLLFGHWGYIGPVLFLHKDVYDTIGLYDEYLAFEDHDFFLKVISQDIIFFSTDVCAKYRIHSQSLSHNPMNRIKGVSAILKSYLKALKLYKSGDRRLLLKAILCKEYLLLKLKIRKFCKF